MRRRTLQNSSEEEKRPIEALSPDGEWKARAAEENTIAVFKKGVGRFGRSLGHQDGMHHRTHATPKEIAWESNTAQRSTSSTSSIHRPSVPQCLHLQTSQPATDGRTA